MRLYLLSVYQPDGDPPPDEVLAKITRDVLAVNDELRAAGAWVFDGGLRAAKTAKVVRRGMLKTDGPYVESKEHIGGLAIIKASSLDQALDWAGRLADATTLPIEVREFQAEPDRKSP